MIELTERQESELPEQVRIVRDVMEEKPPQVLKRKRGRPRKILTDEELFNQPPVIPKAIVPKSLLKEQGYVGRKWNEIELRRLMQNELDSLLSKKKDEFGELKAVLRPATLKAEIRTIIKNEMEVHIREGIFKTLKKEMEQLVYQQVNEHYEDAIVEEFIDKKMKRENLKKMVDEKVTEHLMTNFKKFADELYANIDRKYAKSITRKMMQDMNLRTSEFSEVRAMLKPIDTTEDVLDKLSKTYMPAIQEGESVKRLPRPKKADVLQDVEGRK